mmetsp:Transcript_15077/g.21993  ORF Transcript_15077/g.21993 Transcript_15077/m.21993 type:complete len:84 (-) Transcript_15077:62-313(-)
MKLLQFMNDLPVGSLIRKRLRLIARRKSNSSRAFSMCRNGEGIFRRNVISESSLLAMFFVFHFCSHASRFHRIRMTSLALKVL